MSYPAMRPPITCRMRAPIGGVPATGATTPDDGRSSSSSGVYRDADSCSVCPSTSPLPCPPRFQYVCCRKFTGVALFSAVAFMRSASTYGLDSWDDTLTTS
uniref:Uncharacterized protein n=1 Tax=Oryza meridionalis TaxID=40149 RepID=A0A0E0DF17_9ORYZ